MIYICHVQPTFYIFQPLYAHHLVLSIVFNRYTLAVLNVMYWHVSNLLEWNSLLSLLWLIYQT